MSVLSFARPFRAGSVLIVGLLAIELLVVSLVYQHGFDFTCRDAAPVWFCAFAGRIVPRALGVLAVLAVFALAHRAFLTNLPKSEPPYAVRLSLNLFGFALILLPWTFLSDESASSFVTLASLSWTLGGAMAALGVALIAVPPAAWVQLLRAHGLLLLGLVAFGLALPELGDLMQPLWRIEAVTDITFQAVLVVLNTVGYVVHAVPETKLIGTEAFAILVGPQCSGVEGFVLVSVFVTLYITLFRQDLRFPQVLLLYPIALGLSWCFNVLRISFLLSIGLEGHPDLAVGAFHSHAGWLAFTILSLLIVLAAHAVPWFTRKKTRPALTLPPFLADPAVVRILPFLVFMLSALLVSTMSTTPSVHYPWRVVAMAAALWLIWPTLRSLPWRLDGVSVGAGAGIAVLWIVTAPSEGSVPYGALTGVAFALWLVARLVGTALFVPIIEELFFRDYLMSRLAPQVTPTDDPAAQSVSWVQSSGGEKVRLVLAVVISTAAFAALHDRWIAAAVAGLVFAALVIRSRNITDAIISHGVANALIAVWALSMDRWHIL